MINRKGQVVIFTVMFAIVVLLLALAFAPILKQFTEDAMASDTTDSIGLDCANSSISNFDKATCTAVDVGQSYFFWGLIGIAGVIIGAKLLVGDEI